MAQVTVDLEDLETLLFGASGIKAIENILVARKHDPFVSPFLNYTAAHDRLSGVLRAAKRGERQDVVVKWDDPLDPEETKILKKLANPEFRGGTISASEKAPKRGQSMSVYDRLVCKGYIQFGQELPAMLWAGASAPEFGHINPDVYFIRLTPRGRELAVTLT